MQLQLSLAARFRGRSDGGSVGGGLLLGCDVGTARGGLSDTRLPAVPLQTVFIWSSDGP